MLSVAATFMRVDQVSGRLKWTQVCIMSLPQYIHWKVVIAEESRVLELREN